MHEEEVGLLTHVSVLLGEELLESLPLVVLLLLESAAKPGEPGLGCCPASVAGAPELIAAPGAANGDDCAFTMASGGHTKSSMKQASGPVPVRRRMILGMVSLITANIRRQPTVTSP